MPDLLLELFSEEIPARMQRRAAEDLKKLVTDALVERGLTYEGAKAFSTPRRLALHVAGLPVKGRDVREERKGPRVGAPEAALQGFLKAAGLTDISQAKIEKDPKKGEFYVAVVEKPGLATPDAIAAIVPQVVRGFPWPKSMRWGAASAQSGSLRWVRPLQSILCTFGPETEEPEVISFEIDGIGSGNQTRGHRFLAPGAIQVRRFDDYVPALEKAKVVLDADRRKDIILTDAKNLAFAQGLELIEDEGLLEEVAGLVEWPVVLMGAFDEQFLDIPAEVIRATIRANQKCFVLRAAHLPLEGGGRREAAGGGDASNAQKPSGTTAHPTPDLRSDPPPQGEGGALANKFILVSNLAASDGGKAIVAGNERVIRARLSDALYFWQTDQKPLPDFAHLKDAAGNQLKSLDQRLEKLKAQNIVFHEKLGTQGERVARIQALAREIAPLVGADPALAARAAELAKADLMTEVVGEFPEVQGLMGRKYAQLQGEHASVCAAIEEHYKPLGPTDRVPTDPVSVAVALADKLDTLVGFWAIDEKPTGSKDPYALRRAALGVIRLVLENALNLPLNALAGVGIARFANKNGFDARSCAADLLSFFHDRLKVVLREQGARHDLVDAVLAPTSPSRGEVAARSGAGGGDAANAPAPAGATAHPTPALRADPPPQGEGGANDDLLMIVRRVEALGKFLETEDGKNLLAGYRRAANILRIEEKKDGEGAFTVAPDAGLLHEAEEKALAAALARTLPAAEKAVAAEDFAGAMTALSQLRAPVDAFFDKVTVNAGDPALRANRLKLLNRLRAATRAVADFSRIEG